LNEIVAHRRLLLFFGSDDASQWRSALRVRPITAPATYGTQLQADAAHHDRFAGLSGYP
jgi:hypothetical protein